MLAPWPWLPREQASPAVAAPAGTLPRMAKNPKQHAALHPEAAPWSEVVVLCTKCMRRQDREDLRGDLRKALKQAGRKDVRVVLSGCLDLCPDDGVTVARGRDLGAMPPQLHVLGNRAGADALAGWVLQPDARQAG